MDDPYKQISDESRRDDEKSVIKDGYSTKTTQMLNRLGTTNINSTQYMDTEHNYPEVQS
eukprot:CAMPEP_0170558858 /NCGR_PEP_ID=MMETSP0211-20121228/38372_1 /TAXON_ID=311385 /ORGANISM="Pseudokeronopsis sp., Strain OXSARD2" /LENGTH=58 /DNA_ID=CAMNT_0010871229 /DNA_START=111 /DNA_END=284 /DNA_ORIENTATION=+